MSFHETKAKVTTPIFWPQHNAAPHGDLNYLSENGPRRIWFFSPSTAFTARVSLGKCGCNARSSLYFPARHCACRDTTADIIVCHRMIRKQTRLLARCSWQTRKRCFNRSIGGRGRSAGPDPKRWFQRHSPGAPCLPSGPRRTSSSPLGCLKRALGAAHRPPTAHPPPTSEKLRLHGGHDTPLHETPAGNTCRRNRDLSRQRGQWGVPDRCPRAAKVHVSALGETVKLGSSKTPRNSGTSRQGDAIN